MKRLTLSLIILSLYTINYSQQNKYASTENIVIPHPPKVKVKNSNYLMNFEFNNQLVFVRGVSDKSGKNAFNSTFASVNAYTKFIADVFTKDFKLKSSNYISGIMKNEKEGLFGRTDGVLSFQYIGGKILFFVAELKRSDYSLKISVISYDIESNKLSERKELLSTKDLLVGTKSKFDKVENGTKILYSYLNGSDSKYMLIDEAINLDKNTKVRVNQASKLIKQDPINGKVLGVYDSKSKEFKDVDFDFGSAEELTLNSMDTEGNGGATSYKTYKFAAPNIINAWRNDSGKIDIIGIEYDKQQKTIGPKFIQYDAESEKIIIEKSNDVFKEYRSIESRGVKQIDKGYIYLGESITYKETGIAFPNYGPIFIGGIGSDGEVKWIKKIERHLQENYIVQMADMGFRYMIKDGVGFIFYKGIAGAETTKKLKNTDLDGIYMLVIDKEGGSEKFKIIDFDDPNYEALRELKFSGNSFIDKSNQAIYFVGNQKKGTSITKVSLK